MVSGTIRRFYEAIEVYGNSAPVVFALVWSEVWLVWRRVFCVFRHFSAMAFVCLAGFCHDLAWFFGQTWCLEILAHFGLFSNTRLDLRMVDWK